jgi:hypothetical protein
MRTARSEARILDQGYPCTLGDAAEGAQVGRLPAEMDRDEGRCPGSDGGSGSYGGDAVRSGIDVHMHGEESRDEDRGIHRRAAVSRHEHLVAVRNPQASEDNRKGQGAAAGCDGMRDPVLGSPLGLQPFHSRRGDVVRQATPLRGA